MKGDIVDLIEAAYAVEQSEAAWLAGMIDAARPAIDHGFGVDALVFDAMAAPKIGSFLGTSERRSRSLAARAVERSTPEYAHWCFRLPGCKTASEGPDWTRQPARRLLARWGIRDVLVITGVDAIGVGCCLAAPLSTSMKLTDRSRRRWARVATHLARGLRLRTKLVERAATVKVPAHEVGSVRQRLRDAVVELDHLRGRAPAEHQQDEWRETADGVALVLDAFDAGGRRYLLTRSDELTLARPTSLSPREREVLAYAALGHPNKVIAYELGITPSTVGVLLSRAALKLRAPSRAALLERFRAWDDSRRSPHPERARPIAT